MYDVYLEVYLFQDLWKNINFINPIIKVFRNYLIIINDVFQRWF